MSAASDALFPIESILLNPELERRPSRPSDHAAANAAMTAIAAEMARPGGNVLKVLTDAALEACSAHSAGISILETDAGQPVFRWHAISGAWAGYEGGCLPRSQSPCGIVLDSNAAQLMANPERYFTNIAGAEPRIHEVLLIPFYLLGEAVGTVWLLSHDESKHFDGEDLRIMGQVANFASAAYCLLESQKAAVDNAMELARSNERLRRTNARLADGIDQEAQRPTTAQPLSFTCDGKR